VSHPDVTLAQILAVVTAALGLVAAFGLNISKDKQDAIVMFVTVMAPIVVLADAAIRHGRSRVAAAQAAPGTLVVNKPPKKK
jgi:hypothetical protein